MKTIRRKTGIGWETLFLGFSKDPRRRNKKTQRSPGRACQDWGWTEAGVTAGWAEGVMGGFLNVCRT